MDHSASASISASWFDLTPGAWVVGRGIATLHHMSASGTGIVSPIEIDVSDPVSVEDDSNAKAEKAQTLLALWLLEMLGDAKRDWPERKKLLQDNWWWIHTLLIIIAMNSCGGD